MDKVIGNIHSIETLGTVDGPGIRFVVFMQGCHLRCKYCHNRDTWDIKAGEKNTVDELIKKILRSKPYFEVSGGGVTVSGGEPLIQAKFITELFKKLHEYGINTCIDTAGSIPISEDIIELLKYTDLVLLDIKHINNEKSIDLVGVSNKNNLDFARYLSQSNIPMWIRQVLVPGYTDDKEDLLELKKFIKTLKNVKKIEILPYHDLGKYKWDKMNDVYQLEGVRTANAEDVKRAKKILEIE